MCTRAQRALGDGQTGWRVDAHASILKTLLAYYTHTNTKPKMRMQKNNELMQLFVPAFGEQHYEKKRIRTQHTQSRARTFDARSQYADYLHV